MMILAAAALYFPLVPALADDFSCPPRIETRQSVSGKAPKGWRAFQDKNEVSILESVAFYDGHPKEMADLAPDVSEDKLRFVWTFAPASAKSRPIWQLCRYTNTRASLIRKLGKEVTTCTVVHAKDVTPQIDSVDCR